MSINAIAIQVNAQFIIQTLINLISEQGNEMSFSSSILCSVTCIFVQLYTIWTVSVTRYFAILFFLIRILLIQNLQGHLL